MVSVTSADEPLAPVRAVAGDPLVHVPEVPKVYGAAGQ